MYEYQFGKSKKCRIIWNRRLGLCFPQCNFDHALIAPMFLWSTHTALDKILRTKLSPICLKYSLLGFLPHGAISQLKVSAPATVYLWEFCLVLLIFMEAWLYRCPERFPIDWIIGRLFNIYSNVQISCI